MEHIKGFPRCHRAVTHINSVPIHILQTDESLLVPVLQVDFALPERVMVVVRQHRVGIIGMGGVHGP